MIIKKVVAPVVVAALVIGGGYYLWHKHQTPPVVAQTPPTISTGPTGSKTTATSNPNVPGASSNASQSTPSGGPQAPSGSFVSAYTASMNTNLTSSCSSTPAATCQIIFNKDGVTKSLPSQVVMDSDKLDTAGTSWSWTPNSIGLTAGSWSVSATATLNGQSKTTQSSVQLVISQ